MIYLCLDPGLAHIGVAISYEGKLAQPLDTFPAHELVRHVKNYIDKYHPDVIVLGEPYSGPIKDLSVILQDELKRIFTGPIELFSEDLTSQEAKFKLVESGAKKSKRQELEHAAAAALILQDYLDSTKP